MSEVNNCKITFTCEQETECAYKWGEGDCIYKKDIHCKSSVANVNAMVIDLKSLGIEVK